MAFHRLNAAILRIGQWVKPCLPRMGEGSRAKLRRLVVDQTFGAGGMQQRIFPAAACAPCGKLKPGFRGRA